MTCSEFVKESRTHGCLLSPQGTHATPEAHIKFHQQFATHITTDEEAYSHPHSAYIQPVYQRLNDPTSDLVGFVHGTLPWDRYFLGLLPEGVRGVYCVLKNSCGEAFTYDLEGPRATYLGPGDLHEKQFQDTEAVYSFEEFDDPELALKTDGHCYWTVATYCKFLRCALSTARMHSSH